MNIGYACLTLGVPGTDFRSCIQKNASDEKLAELIAHNLNSLEHVIDYNIRNQIRLFRISSDLIPFASSPVNRLPWWDLFETQFSVIGEKLKVGKIRVSMHPGQYTVLNSPNESVVERAALDLNYHAKVLEVLNTGTSSKIVLHIGGIYGDKTLAMQRFEENYKQLEPGVKRRLVIENDDRSYTISDALQIGIKLGIPVVFDNLHHKINPCSAGASSNMSVGEHDDSRKDTFWISEAGKTWKEEDGPQKIHYSQQDPQKRSGSHSASIGADEFLSYFSTLNTSRLDVMLEVKDKNLSAIKCINLISEQNEIKALEQEWSRYKYNVLEHSPNDYEEIRRLLRDKTAYPSVAFYRLMEEALKKEMSVGNSINAAQHVWGYFRDLATEREKQSFLNCAEDYRQGRSGLNQLKKILRKLTEKYQEPYLLKSYYFVLDE